MYTCNWCSPEMKNYFFFGEMAEEKNGSQMWERAESALDRWPTPSDRKDSQMHNKFTWKMATQLKTAVFQRNNRKINGFSTATTRTNSKSNIHLHKPRSHFSPIRPFVFGIVFFYIFLCAIVCNWQWLKLNYSCILNDVAFASLEISRKKNWTKPKHTSSLCMHKYRKINWRTHTNQSIWKNVNKLPILDDARAATKAKQVGENVNWPLSAQYTHTHIDTCTQWKRDANQLLNGMR